MNNKIASKKILIVDDENLARERIKRFLAEISISKNHFELAEAQDGLSALEKIGSFCPDVVFLDIQMPGLTGLEILQQIENRNFQIIFQTAYDEFAIKAFEQNACDYLLKPFSKERLEASLNKAFNLIAQKEALARLEASLNENKKTLDKIAVKQGGKLRVIETRDVECFVSRDHYTCIYSKGQELVSELSLNWLEERLDDKKFIRCHRNNIISSEQIKSVTGTKDSEIELKNGMTLPLSRNNRKTVIELVSK